METTYEEIKQIVEDKLVNKTEYRTYEELSETLFGEGNCFSDSEVRKRMYGMQRLINVIENESPSSAGNSNDTMASIAVAKRELEQAKIQFRDERNAWNAQNRIDARVSQKLDCLETALKEAGEAKYESVDIAETDVSDNDLLVILSDLHVGQTFSSAWGEYNSNIAKQRLDKYLSKIINIRTRYRSQDCYVSIQGDLISGSIHKSIQISNRENVIEQIKIAAKLITDFCYGLSPYFRHVIITNVSGNHSRIDKKEDSLHDERLDDLIGWIVSSSLSHVKNIEFRNRNIDIGIASIDIRGKEYIAVHGDFDSFSTSGVGKLCLMLHRIPYAIIYGHLHRCSFDETNGVKMIRGGSLAGSGDSYTIEKRLDGRPYQMVCVCTEDGVDSYHPVELN